MSVENKLSRREFIKEAAVGAAAVAGAGALALGSTPVQAQGPSALPAKWDKVTDVLVVGSGLAGLPAAIKAKAAGADVIVIEKGEIVGGLTCQAGPNAFFCNTHVQKRLGVEDRIEWGIADEMEIGSYHAVPEIVRMYVERGAETCLWLEQLGIEWSNSLQQNDGDVAFGTHVKRNHTPKASKNYPHPGGAAYIVVLLKEINRLGIPILVKHRMSSIYREPNGPVQGVAVETPAGKINIKARKAVILAAGGYTTNEQMVKAIDPRLVGDAFYSDGLPYTTSMGEAILAATDIGAGIANMDHMCLCPKLGSHIYKLWEPPVLENAGGGAGVGGFDTKAEGQRAILVKGDGMRYIDETEGAETSYNGIDFTKFIELPFMQKFLNLPEPKNVWAITDDDGATTLKWAKDEMRNPKPLDPKGHALWPDSVAVADTLKELAAKMGMPPASLEATVAKYNGFVDAGKDADFGKPMPMFKLAKPPFFAAKFNVIRHTPYGGVLINTKCQVLERSEQNFDDSKITPTQLLGENARFKVAKSVDQQKTIPHLYAVGETASRVGWRRWHRQQGIHVTFGIVAGENAAKETPLAGT